VADLLSPVTPQKIICVGRNYRDHAKELGTKSHRALLFFKPYRRCWRRRRGAHAGRLERVDFEGELALIIGKRVSKLAGTPTGAPLCAATPSPTT